MVEPGPALACSRPGTSTMLRGPRERLFGELRCGLLANRQLKLPSGVSLT
jgi:hypothetical protein